MRPVGPFLVTSVVIIGLMAALSANYLRAELPSGAHTFSKPLPLQHQNWVRVGDRLLSPSSWRAVGLALTCWTASGRWVKDARGVNASTGLPIMYRSHSLSLSYSVYKREAKQVLTPKACCSY